MTPAWTRTQRAALVLVLLAGALGRAAAVGRPLDHRLVSPWREADHVQVARNFQRGDLNILYPRIDWRGDLPGYAEMELPVLPWIGAALARGVGYSEPLLRLPSATLSILGLVLFAWMARAALPASGALFAVAAFALNPLLVAMGSALQPDALMQFLVLLAMALLWRWSDDPTAGKLLLACAVTGAAILAKLPALHLGIVIAYLLMRTQGVRVLATATPWVGAILALVAPLLWYEWAHRFWLQYGLSLGVSNESHFIGWDMLVPPRFLVGLVKWETLAVFTPAGWILAAAAFRQPFARIERFVVWYAAVGVFYVVSARTAADDWAFYYHGISVAPACLLMGAGLGASEAGGRWLGRALAAGTLIGLVAATSYVVYKRDQQPQLRAMRACVLAFATHVPPDGAIVVSGGDMRDQYGRPVAYNESMAFAWMDRKGFNYGREELGIATLDRIAGRGGRYWIAREDELGPELKASVARHYRELAHCEPGYALYDLQERPR